MRSSKPSIQIIKKTLAFQKKYDKILWAILKPERGMNYEL